jgi:hypothetical protein
MAEPINQALSSKFPSRGDADGVYELLGREVMPLLRKLKDVVNQLTGETGDLSVIEADIAAIELTIATLAPATMVVETVADATYALVAADAGKYKRCTNVAGCQVTVAAGILTEGQVVHLRATEDQLELVESGVTIHKSQTLFSAGAHSPLMLVCLNDAGTEFDLLGDMELAP